jgi:hypothetical protein
MFPLHFVRVGAYPVSSKIEAKPDRGKDTRGRRWLNKRTDRFRDALIVVDHTIKSYASARCFGAEQMTTRCSHKDRIKILAAGRFADGFYGVIPASNKRRNRLEATATMEWCERYFFC